MQYWDKRALMPETNLPYRVHTIGRIVNTPQHATMGTYNQDCMLTLFTAGEGYYVRKGVERRVLPGMVGLVLPQEDPGLLMSDRDNPYEHYFSRFAGGMALEAARRIIAENGGESFFVCEQWRELLEVFLRLMVSVVPEEPNLAERMRPCDALLAEVLALLDCRGIGQNAVISLRAVEHFISEHLGTPLDIGVMAEYFGVSREYLCRKVRAVTGRTSLDLWRDFKIDWARKMLQSTNMQVQEISWRLGFSNQYYFSKVFRKCTGQSPSAVRRCARESL